MKLKKIQSAVKVKRVKTQGFTLIELLVAMVITAMMLTLIMASYWIFLQTQQRMQVSREAQSEIRFALNRFADKIRASRIDYAAYDGSSVPLPPCANADPGGASRICLTDGQGSFYFFEHRDTNNDSTLDALFMGQTQKQAIESEGDARARAAADAQPLISTRKFNVGRLKFSFSPALDPSILTNDQMQPKVTIFISANSAREQYQDIVIETQTTISSRQY